MWAKERHRRILAILESSQQASANGLAELLGVSRETIRRDLVDLEHEGHVRRVHGGAVLPEPAAEPPFRKRMQANRREKREIAAKAATLIRPGQCIMVDAGTTTSVFAHELIKLPGILVITNSIDLATTIRAAQCDVEVLLLGGKLVSDVPGTFGELTLSEIRRFSADFAFVSPVALHPDRGAFDFDLHEAEVAGAMIGQAEKTVMLVDHGKLGTTSRVLYCTPDRIDILVTDGAAPPDMVESIKGRGTRVLV